MNNVYIDSRGSHYFYICFLLLYRSQKQSFIILLTKVYTMVPFYVSTYQIIIVIVVRSLMSLSIYNTGFVLYQCILEFWFVVRIYNLEYLFLSTIDCK